MQTLAYCMTNLINEDPETASPIMFPINGITADANAMGLLFVKRLMKDFGEFDPHENKRCFRQSLCQGITIQLDPRKDQSFFSILGHNRLVSLQILVQSQILT